MTDTGKRRGSKLRPAADTKGPGSLKRAAEAMRQRAEELDSLNALGREVNSRLAPAKVVAFAAKEVLRLVAPDVVMVHLREGDELVLKAVRPVRPKFSRVGRGLHRIGDCLCGLAAASGRPVYSADIHADARCTLPECRAAGIRSFVAMPLRARGEVLGTLSLGATAPRDFREHGAFLEALAGELAVGLRNALLHEQLSRHAAELEREVRRRKLAERGLKQANATLEKRIAQRTALAETRAVQLRALAANLASAERRERRRVARVLHEEVQQLVVAAKYRLALLADRPQAKALRRPIGQADRLLDQAIKTLRSLSAEFCPPILQSLGLGAALEWLGRQMNRRYGLEVRLELDEAAQPAQEDLSAFLFESVRELLFNIAKHAQTKAALVRTRRRGGEVLIEVADRGIGFDPSGLGASGELTAFGLFGLRERVELIGGRLEIISAPGKGCKVTIEAPLGPRRPARRRQGGRR